jgi:Protein of unknown function (DUF3168)
MSVVDFDLELSADVERLVSVALRESPEIVALVEQRVYTVWPKTRADDAKQPLVMITRTGGAPAVARPLALDVAELQIDAYGQAGGGRKHATWKLASTLHDALVDLVDAVRPEGVVHGVVIDAIRYVPDESFDPPRSRYVTDVTVTVSPPRPVAEGS